MTGQPITFLVPGRPSAPAGGLRDGSSAPLPAGLKEGRVKQSIQLNLSRGGGGPIDGERLTPVVAVPGADVVVLRIAGGPDLVLHPDSARDLLRAQSQTARGGTGAARLTGEVEVPLRLQWRGLEQAIPARGRTRGWLGDVLLSAIEIVTDISIDSAAGATASALAAYVDAQVTPGVYALAPDSLQPMEPDARRPRIPSGSDDAPLLMFVHGAFTNTAGSFSRLWTHHPHLVRALFERYAGRLYALEHQTIGLSPVANALMAAEALPARARVHLVTHSRGGLVAEVLARAAAASDKDLKSFADHAGHHEGEDLRRIAALIRDRDLHIERVVRVACPARGTLLASRRLDAYLSVFKWSLELAGVPAAPTLVDFLASVAKRRSEPDEFPGLAAQTPDSPLVRWLNSAARPIDGQLRVVAGDIQGDSVTSWLKTLLTDAFYWTDHDLIVQTRSMYGGARRRDAASFVFDQGSQISHFSYFGNDRTARAIVSALVEDRPHGFRAIGTLSHLGESSTGVRSHPAGPTPRPAGSKGPAVILVADGAAALASSLSKTHDVIEFPFDWRMPLEEEAIRLADVISKALDDRKTTDDPVSILAHSIGGLIARAVQTERPNVWTRMFARKDARLLMLGTPNRGWWAPMQLLSGDDASGYAVAASGMPFEEHEVRREFAGHPGLMQSQAALLDKSLGLGQQATWKKLAEADVEQVRIRNWWHNTSLQMRTHRWGVPRQQILDRAVAFRKRLDAQVDLEPAGFADRLLLVVGAAALTPDGYEVVDGELQYLEAVDAGDGRVTHASAVMPGVRTWTIDADHATLPRQSAAFGAYLELLQQGHTTRLAPLGAGSGHGDVRAAAHVHSRLSRSRAANQPSGPADLYSVAHPQEPESPASPGTALRITVVNGDLSFVSKPLIIGHYRSMRLTGTEWVMNRLIGGTMADSLLADLYPDQPGTHQIFVNARVDPENPWQLPRPEAVVVAGLGEEGSLQSADLVHTVRQAVLAWSQRAAERPDGAAVTFDLAATLLGSGGSGITVGQSAQLIAQGVREANRTLDDQRENTRRWPRVGHLHLIELYLDRAGEAWRALRMQSLAAPGDYVVSETVETGTGPLPRPIDSGYRGADYDLIRAVTERGSRGLAGIAYTLDTRRARTEVRAQAMQDTLLRELVARASNDRSRDTQIGRTLFQLLVPIELEPFLGGTTEMVIELDSGTAGIPWELLDTTTGAGRDQRPWAIRTRLLRKLRTAEFRAQVTDANADSSVLVIGEPGCEPNYPRLPGARAEARNVVEILTSDQALAADKVTALISPDDPSEAGPDARTILNALLERNWRIVHVAGHGEPPERVGPAPVKPDDPPQMDGDPRGVVLSNRTYLGPREIRSMRTVPELVFVNCCHLAARNTAQVLGEPHDQARFAAGVAEELIRIGVRCVIAAGWAVEDGPACEFATVFYEALLSGRRFIDAVAEAREAAASFGGNTWAAYQCYGDPDWTFRLAGGDAQRPRTSPGDELGGIASAVGLAMALETLSVRSKFQNAPAIDQQARLRYLETRFAAAWGSIGRVAEAFGVAWSAAGGAAKAIAWYERALAANDGTASMKAVEQLANIQGRLAWESVDAAMRGATAPPLTAVPRRRTTRRAGERAPGVRALTSVVATARKDVGAAISRLERLVAIEPTMERESLCGSAYKRLALIEAAAGRAREERRALSKMQGHYARGESLGREAGLTGFFYPALNRIAAEIVLKAGQRDWSGLDPAAIARIRRGLATTVRDNPDFWSVASQIELTVYEAVAKRALARARRSVEAACEDLHARVAAPRMWASVRDQAHFVLRRYAAGGPAAEQRAALALIETLERYATAAHGAGTASRPSGQGHT